MVVKGIGLPDTMTETATTDATVSIEGMATKMEIESVMNPGDTANAIVTVTGIGIDMVVEVEVMTTTDIREGIVMMTAEGSVVVGMRSGVDVGGMKKNVEVVVVGAENAKLALLNDDLPLLWTPSHSHSESERLAVGMFMLPVMSSTLPCRLSKQVGFNKLHELIQFPYNSSRSLQPSWRQSNPDSPNFGSSWSSPTVARSNIWDGHRSQPQLVTSISSLIHWEHNT